MLRLDGGPNSAGGAANQSLVAEPRLRASVHVRCGAVGAALALGGLVRNLTREPTHLIAGSLSSWSAAKDLPHRSPEHRRARSFAALQDDKES